MSSLRIVHQHLFTLTQSEHLIQDTFNYVRENVRLYNCVGLVSDVYFVFFRDYLGLYG